MGGCRDRKRKWRELLMAEYLTNNTDLKKVADAIRTKGGTADPLVYPDGFAEAIRNIQTGSPAQEKSVTITANGTTEITPDEGKLLNKVTVGVDVPDWETWVFNEEFSNIPLASDNNNIVINGEIVAFVPEVNEEIVIERLVIRINRKKVFAAGCANCRYRRSIHTPRRAKRKRA